MDRTASWPSMAIRRPPVLVAGTKRVVDPVRLKTWPHFSPFLCPARRRPLLSSRSGSAPAACRSPARHRGPASPPPPLLLSALSIPRPPTTPKAQRGEDCGGAPRWPFCRRVRAPEGGRTAVKRLSWRRPLPAAGGGRWWSSFFVYFLFAPHGVRSSSRCPSRCASGSRGLTRP